MWLLISCESFSLCDFSPFVMLLGASQVSSIAPEAQDEEDEMVKVDNEG